MPDTVPVPWSNGTSWGDWQSRNCDRCPLSYDNNDETWRCDLEKSIYYNGMVDGTLPVDIARRLGVTDSVNDGFACKERLLLERNGGTIPADVLMKRAGAPMLPGFGQEMVDAIADQDFPANLPHELKS